MEVEKTEKGLKITPTKKIIKLLEIFNMGETRSVATPMKQNFQSKEDETILEDISYRKLVCSLIYLSLLTRPDISYSVTYLNRFLDKPTKRLWEAGKRILRYLNQTKDLGLVFTKGNSDLIGYSDADWSGDRSTRKSASGFVCFFGTNPIAWHSRKQNCVAQSSMEAEYISAGVATQELININGLLTEFKVSNTIIIKLDNFSAISLKTL